METTDVTMRRSPENIKYLYLILRESIEYSSWPYYKYVLLCHKSGNFLSVFSIDGVDVAIHCGGLGRGWQVHGSSTEAQDDKLRSGPFALEGSEENSSSLIM